MTASTKDVSESGPYKFLPKSHKLHETHLGISDNGMEQILQDDPAPKASGYGEHAVALTLLAALLLLYIAYVFRYRIGSDETQHLHVIWGWAHGLLQYRDVFDNHMPLFHLLYTPLFVAFGERPEVLFLMRLAMVPSCGLALWSIYRIGCVLFSPRVGLWATVLAGLFPAFFFSSIEFHTDTLWTALWLLALAVLVEESATRMRSFTVGVILGTAVGVSMKTLLLLTALGVAILAVVALTAKRDLSPALRQVGLHGAVALVGLLLVPLALTLFFAVQGAWTPFFYGTIEHNIVPGLGSWHTHPERPVLFPVTLPLLWWGARTLVLGAPTAHIGTRRAVIFLAAGLYIVLLCSFWPLLPRQDYLPFYPPLFLLLTPALLALPRWIATRWRSHLPIRPLPDALAPTLVAVLEISVLLGCGVLWRDGTRDQTDLLADVLRLTQPDNPIMDTKGESVFRQRPFYYALEGITLQRIRQGLIADDIPERLIATHTCVAVEDSFRFPPRARAFLQANYLPIGRLRVAGRLLTPSAADGPHALPFDVQIAARYAVVAESGVATGWLDGTPYDGARFLAPGHHEFRSASADGRFALVWAQAVERGFSPFLLRSEPP